MAGGGTLAEISSLAYVVLGAADFDAWAAFAGDIVGFHVTRPDDHQLVLRMDEHELRAAVERDPRDDVVAGGWTFDTPPSSTSSWPPPERRTSTSDRATPALQADAFAELLDALEIDRLDAAGHGRMHLV